MPEKAQRRYHPSVTLVGAGGLAGGVACALHAAGYTIAEVVARPAAASQRHARALAQRVEARAVTLHSAKLEAPIVWLCVPDGAIAACAAQLAPRGAWKGKVVLHGSGALGSAELASLAHRGAATGALHPMMSFVRGEAPSLRGVLFAFEGHKVAAVAARRIVRDLGGRFFSVRPQDKPLYHAWGSFSSPLLMATLAVGELAARRAGVPRSSIHSAIAPIVERTLDNYRRKGSAGALTGPLVRGDLVTIRRHLEALNRVPLARDAYLALTRAALELLPVKERAALRRLLAAASRRTRRS